MRSAQKNHSVCAAQEGATRMPAGGRNVTKAKQSHSSGDGWYILIVLFASYFVLFWSLGGFGPQPARETRKPL